ncbi:MAG: hypothetical protein AAB215_05175 [Planctomycetota bacterium]
MESAATLRLDLSGLSAAVIGEATGLGEPEIREAMRDGEEAAARVRADHESGKKTFLALPFDRNAADHVLEYAARAAGRFENVAVLGIGGSALPARLLQGALLPPYWNFLPERERRGRPRLFVCDNVDPAEFEGLLKAAPPDRTLFLVISKSGRTPETLAQFQIVWERLKKTAGNRAKEHVAIVTDPAKGALLDIARAERIEAFEVPPRVGGRFSVLSPVGLLPAALVGIDVMTLLAGGARMAEHCLRAPATENPGTALAALHRRFAKKGRTIAALMPYASGLEPFTEWFSQLWGECLGAPLPDGTHTGLTPLRALGATDQHSLLHILLDGPADKVVGFVAVDDPGADVPIPAAFPKQRDAARLGGSTLGRLLDVERRATAAGLAERRRPHWTLHLPRLDPASIGAAVVLFEHATWVLGHLLGMDRYPPGGLKVVHDRIEAALDGKAANTAPSLPPPATKPWSISVPIPSPSPT